MASPQKENGFTAIANEILEQLVKACLLGSEYQLVYFVIRKTYGFHKKEDKISLTQFELGTNLSRPTVVKSLKNLVSRKILLRSENLKYKFNKDHETWVVKAPLLVKSNSNIGKGALTKTSKGALTHKRKKEITKENTFSVENDSLNKIMKNTFRYNENQHTDTFEDSIDLDTGEAINPKKKDPKNKTALKLISIFNQMCLEKIKTTPVEARGNYFAVLKAMKNFTPEQIVVMMDEWFKSGKEPQELIQITHCLTLNQQNRFKVNKKL